MQFQKDNPSLTIVGVTGMDSVDVEAFFPEAPRPVPVLTGMDKATSTAWDISGFPNVRVVKDGKRVGDTMDALKAALAN